MGFFIGTEPDPVVPNSKCVLYFPTLKNQIDAVITGFNTTLIIPTKFVGWLDSAFTLVNRYALWQGYCQFGTLFTSLDNVLETFDGITTVFYRVIFNYSTILIFLGDLTAAYNSKDCRGTFKAIGQVFSLALNFNVPEDIV